MSSGAKDPFALATLAAQFLSFLEAKGHPSPTIKTRRLQLARFVAWCEERELVRAEQVTRKHVEAYQRWLFHFRKPEGGRPLSWRTQSGCLIAVVVWFRWLKKQSLVLINPASELELPKADRSLPVSPLTADEMEATLASIDPSDIFGLRDRAVFETLYSTALRRAELCALKILDLDTERGIVVVRRGKGGRGRIVPIGARAIEWISEYLRDARPRFVKGVDEGFLFLTIEGNGIAPDWLTARAKKLMKTMGRNRPFVASHVFRHTAATLMLEGGADVRHIQQFLGHQSLSSTQVYTKVSITHLKEVHTRTHPAKAEPSDSNASNAPTKKHKKK